MTAEEIFKASVKVMKDLMNPGEMNEILKRARDRGERENDECLKSERENVNELVRKIAEGRGFRDLMDGVSRELKDALVLRYVRNREIFMKTFPEGIDDIDADPVSVWAAMMISPQDEVPVRDR